MTGEMMQLMNDGGLVMWGLLALSIVALATSIERTIVLRRARLDSDAFLAQLRHSLLVERSVKRALAASTDAAGPVARVAAAALRRFERSPQQLEQLMVRQAQREERILSRRLRVLATIATTAPLLGFLGTVTGMMASFHILGEGIDNPAAVALGIKEALTTTAGGLAVAVPVQIVYNTLTGRVDRIVGDIENVGNFLLECREEIG